MYPFRTSSYGKMGKVYPFCSLHTFEMINLDTIKCVEIFYFYGAQVQLFDIHRIQVPMDGNR